MKQIRFLALAVLTLVFFNSSGYASVGHWWQSAWEKLSLNTAHAEKESAPTTVATAAPASRPPAVTDNVKDLFVELSKRLVPAVVNIYTTQTLQNPWGNGPQADLYRRFFENFFGEDAVPNVPQSRRATSLGTGFIIDEKENLVLTNYHVIADSDDVKVVLTEQDSDQDGIEAKIVGGDAEADVALLKIKTKRKLQAAPLGDSDQIEVGEWVMAVGNPFGHGHTVTKGIISAKERNIPISQYANYIQTDTPINPGNSGGPLINVSGQVIGINTAINAAAQGIGFAIPINYVKRILPELRSKGAVTRGFIGVNFTELTSAMAKSLQLKSGTRGVVVTEVQEASPASKVGLQAWDVLIQVGDRKLLDGKQLVGAISNVAPGQKIKLKYLRQGKEHEVEVEVGSRSSHDALLGRKSTGPKGPSLRLQTNSGLVVDAIDPDTLRELSLPTNTQGVLVTKVSPASPAEEAGLRRGDVIVEVDQKPTPDLDSFYNTVKDEKVYLLRIRRTEGFAITSLDLAGK